MGKTHNKNSVNVFFMTPLSIRTNNIVEIDQIKAYEEE